MGGLITFLVIIIILVGWLFFGSYNKLQRGGQEIHEALSNISVAITKKINLINQLMDVVQSYQDNEKFVHLTISKDTGVEAVYHNNKNANMMMTSLQGIASRYPDLKSNEHYHKLMDNIESCEQDVANWRNEYNFRVKQYNSERSTIPTVFVANALSFSIAPYLDLNNDNTDENLLKNFKTDDGERLNALLKTAKDNVMEGSKNLASTSKEILHKATEAGKNFAHSEQVQNLINKTKSMTHMSHVEDKEFFYLLPDSTPKGPIDIEKIIELTEDEQWQATVKLSEVNSDEWLDYDAWYAKYIEQPDENKEQDQN